MVSNATLTKEGKKWFPNRKLTLNQVIERNSDIPNSRLEKIYKKMVNMVGLDPNSEAKEILVFLRKEINRRNKEGIFVFNSKIERKQLTFKRNLVDSRYN